MNVEVLESPGSEEIYHRGIVERRGARTGALAIRLNLREWPLDLLGAHRSVFPVVVALFLWWFSFCTSARVDVGQVGRVRLG